MTHSGDGSSIAFIAWCKRAMGKSRGIKGTRSPSSKEPASISSPFNVSIAMSAQNSEPTRAVTVFCGSSSGTNPAFEKAALSVGKALVEAGRPLVYGGGSMGIMGAVSGAVLEAGGDVTGIVPYAMVAAGGEIDQTKGIHAPHVQLKEKGRERAETIVVSSMHERKAEMARRSCAFIGLPGGYGTFEEVLEVVCWSQIGIHSKPVLVVNVLNFYDPLRALIRNGIENGFILEKNEKLIKFVEGPEDRAEHENFDWGKATTKALDEWEGIAASHFYNWTLRKDGKTDSDTLGAS
ncbi:hypothetical protein C8Q76DRAFT_796449 [Earliella scabrosa]|nr:hypothetical protein C8Q76DRAFT_796449 [Earliella scabrosa]